MECTFTYYEERTENHTMLKISNKIAKTRTSVDWALPESAGEAHCAVPYVLAKLGRGPQGQGIDKKEKERKERDEKRTDSVPATAQ